jgi:type VI secretion system protein ImpK
MQDDNDPIQGEDGTDRTVIMPAPGGGRRREAGSAVEHSSGIWEQRDVGGFEGTTSLPEGIGPNPLLRAANGLFALVRQLRTVTTHHDVSALRLSVLDAIKTFERRARALGADHEAAFTGRYLVCALIDETVLATPWGAESTWNKEGLLVSLHKDSWGGETVFHIGQRCAEDPGKHIDLLELLYVCLCLGFAGKYRVVERGNQKLEQIRQRLSAIIRAERGAGESELSPNWKGVQDRRPKVSRYVPLWVVPVAAVALIFVIYWGFNIWLSRSSDAVVADLNLYIGDMEKVALEGPELPARSLPSSLVEEAPNQIAIGLRQHLAEEISAGLLEVLDVGRGAKIVLRNKSLFRPGSADVGGNYPAIVTKIASYLSKYPGPFKVTGHTDKVPINTPRFPSNWQLSKARAEAIAKLMSGPLRGDGRILTEGRADTEPVAIADTKEAYAQNRRVEIAVPADGESGRRAAAASAEGSRKK